MVEGVIVYLAAANMQGMPHGQGPPPGGDVISRRRGSGIPPAGVPPPLMEDEGDQHAHDIMSAWLASENGAASDIPEQVKDNSKRPRHFAVPRPTPACACEER